MKLNQSGRAGAPDRRRILLNAEPLVRQAVEVSALSHASLAKLRFARQEIADRQQAPFAIVRATRHVVA